MSVEWGGLTPDLGLRDMGGEDLGGSTVEADPEAGAWPEEIDVRVVAESAVSIPGKGSPGANCGEWYPAEFCDECGEPYFGESRCEQRVCPDCWAAWSRRRAEKITRRLGAARYAEPAGLSKRAIHGVISPPEGEIRTLTDVKRGYRDAYDLAKEKGIRGGVVIFHGFRVTDRGKRLFGEAQERGEWDPQEDGKLWAFVRSREKRVERGIGEGKEWRGLVYWSPHYHILGLCEDFEADDPDAQGGWVARRIRPLDSFKLHQDGGYEDMVGAARYLLSHGTFETDTSKDCVRWFGELATRKFSPEKALSEGDLETVEERAREAAGVVDERGEGPAEAEPEPCDNCGGTSRSPIWEAGGALMDPGWCHRIGREQERKLIAAFEWAIGERKPPPGLQNPRSEEQAEEALESVI